MTNYQGQLDPQIAAVLAVLPTVDVANRTPETARAGMRAATTDAAPDDGVVRTDDLEAGVPVRRYQGTSEVTVVFAHGGGWVSGDLQTHDRICAQLSLATGASVVAVDYRRAPENPFPDPLDDVLAVSASLINALGADRVALAGDSAGANLVAVAAQELVQAGQSVRAVLLLYPATDLSGRYREVNGFSSRSSNASGYFLSVEGLRWFTDHYCGSTDSTNPRLSPLLGQLQGLPPHVIGVAEFDLLRDEGLAYAAALQSQGVQVSLHHGVGLIHGYCGFAGFSLAAAAETRQVAAAFTAHLAASSD